jgi:hypothetical protein
MRRRVLLCALTVTLLPLAADARVVSPAPVDYEAGFARSFPALADAHRIADWKLYAAFAAGDIVAYAARIDPEMGRRVDEAHGKAYQTQQLAAEIRNDKRTRDSFEQQRRRVQSLVLYADDAGDGCQRSLQYIANEFRLVFGGTRDGSDPLAGATIAPSCNAQADGGLQLTAGNSPRFRCWTSADAKTCGWRLPDMPAALKQVIESDYPTAIKLRWRWRGLGSGTHVRYADINGNRVSAHDSVVVTTPVDLRLEFVDAKGQVLWTAAASPFTSRHE